MIERRHIWNVLTWLMVLVNAFPILWMVWCSLMGNNEILQGKTMPDPQRNDVLYVDTLPSGEFLAGTVNGELYSYPKSGKDPRRLNLGRVSSTYYRLGQDLWTISADGGVERVDLNAWKVEDHFDWDWVRDQYLQMDHTPFIWHPGDSLGPGIGQLAARLTAKPLVDGSDGPSLTALTHVNFPASSAILDSLNRVMGDSAMLANVLVEWKKSSNWFNPVIPWLFSKTRSFHQDRELFRWCLAERFPGPLSRYQEARWTDVWVNRIPGSGHGTSITPCGDQICFALWWDEFPGIGILDPKSGKLDWITLHHGLPSTSIQHLLAIGNNELFVVTDAGLSLVDLRTRRVTRNYLYGEYGLKYLDGRDVRLVTTDSSHVLLSYGQEVLNFNFRTGENKVLYTKWLANVASDITSLDLQQNQMLVGTSEGVFELPLSTWLDSATVAPRHLVGLFQDSVGATGVDYVIHTMQIHGSVLRIGGLFGSVARVNMDKGTPEWRARVPEGRFNLHWRNYEDLWKTIPFGRFLRNSFVICISVMLISMFVASLASYALVRFDFPGKRIFSATIMATQMVPGILYLIPIFIVFTAIQQTMMVEMVNTWHGIILVYAAFFIPMSTWILRGFFASIPRELEEAALIDGCSPFGAFFRIVLPAALPGIIATGIYVFLLAWDELMFAWVLCTDTSTATIPVGIRLYVGQFGNRFDLLMAAASIATLPVMVLFFLMQRHIVTGLTGGAVKG